MDLDRITHPLRLARGSHQPGSGKGCAMNVISYVNGDEQITDFPATSARPLASFVQLCNDLLAGPDGYLSPDDSDHRRRRAASQVHAGRHAADRGLGRCRTCRPRSQ
jgi:hypothetical protein